MASVHDQTAGPRVPVILVGNTPMVEITRIDSGPCRLFVKLENQNPTGSIKDRMALAMVEASERDGQLSPGGTIVEAT
jgi:cystathionine beta-synthase